MRCPKCGYVSFDYLPRCKKCSRDLAQTRRTLNLTDAKPAAPFLLGSLVGATVQDSGRERLSGLSLTQETELELSSLDVGGSSPPEDTRAKGGGDGGGSPKPLSAPAEPDPPSVELSLDDLTKDESHGGTEEPATGQDGESLGLDIDIDEMTGPKAPAEGLDIDLDEMTGPKAPAEGLGPDEPGPEAGAESLKLDEEGLATAADELSLDTDTPEDLAKELELDVDLMVDRTLIGQQKEDKPTTLTMDFGRPSASGPAPRGVAADDPMPELEAALLEMEKEL